MIFLSQQKLRNSLAFDAGPLEPSEQGRGFHRCMVKEQTAPLALQPRGIDRRFERLLPVDDWQKLPIAVQNRFRKRLDPGQSVVYRGQVSKMMMTRKGWLLAQIARLIGAPLPLDRASTSRPAMVCVSDDEATNGQIWTRIYCKRHGFPQAVNSVKRFEGPTGLEEHIGAGIGMGLKLRVDGAALLFEADHYFVKILGLKLRLPFWLAPGEMTIGHHDMSATHGEGVFAFSLDLVHPRFGALIHQTVLFTDMQEATHG